MAKIETISVVDAIKGKLDKNENLVFSKRFGQTYAWEMTPSTKEPTAAQLAVQSRFAEAASKAAADMADPEKKAEWQAVADASNGKWKTARGAAFASYYAASVDFD
jgi:hypothetical protein